MASFLDPDTNDTHTFSVDTTTDVTKGKVTDNDRELAAQIDTL